MQFWVLSAHDFNHQPLQILLVWSRHKLCKLFVVRDGVEGLAPVHLSAFTRSSQFNGQDEVMTGEVFDFEYFVGGDSREAAFVGIVRSVGAVHGESPCAAGLKVELVNGVCEAVGAPPACDSRGIAHRGDYLSGTCCDERAA